MKKVAFILLLASTITACGGTETKVQSADSTVVDSAAVEEVVVDSNTAHIPSADPVDNSSTTHEELVK